jgi:uncharacterized protein YndB with AHSA1/START domain
MTTQAAQTTQVYQLFIKATPEAIWEAITKPEFTHRYFYGSRIVITEDSYRGLDADGTELVAGHVYELDPPRKLVHGWRTLYDPELAAEDESRVSWEIEPQEDGVSLLTVVHDRLETAPKTASHVAGVGWMRVLSGLKTLLETGSPLGGA